MLVDPEPVLSDGTKLSDKTSIGVCSDVNNIYIIYSVYFKFRWRLWRIDSDTRRAFIILYGHTEAMRLERFEEAEHFYDVLKNNFSNCSNNIRINTRNCGC